MRISDWSSDVCSSDLPAAVRQGMREIDFVLNSCWRLGKTIVAGWSHQGAKISFCFSESYNVLGKAEAMPRLIRGKRLMGPRTFADACRTLRARPMEMEEIGRAHV